MKTESARASVNKESVIGVVMGGPSSEREVSLETGRGVHQALCELGYNALALDWQAGGDLPELLKEARVEVVWNALHGTFGEDGAVQGLCACMGIACTGSGVLASALAMDKVASKRVFASAGIPTPRWQIYSEGEPIAIELPLVVKPANEGSSVGVSVVFEDSQLAPALALAAKHCGPILIEEYIAGSEVFVGVLDGQAIGTIEVRPAKGFYDYEAKYERNDTQYLIPAPLSEQLSDALQALGARAHQVLDCSSYSRVDIRVREDGEAFVLEVNTLPGMTGASLMPKLAKHAGISYPQLCERILLAAR